MRWVRFQERAPGPREPRELPCVDAGGRPFLHHWFIDDGDRTENPEFYWLEGWKPTPLPPVPAPDPELKAPSKKPVYGQETSSCRHDKS